jgi:hypothetical protein
MVERTRRSRASDKRGGWRRLGSAVRRVHLALVSAKAGIDQLTTLMNVSRRARDNVLRIATVVPHVQAFLSGTHRPNSHTELVVSGGTHPSRLDSSS